MAANTDCPPERRSAHSGHQLPYATSGGPRAKENRTSRWCNDYLLDILNRMPQRPRNGVDPRQIVVLCDEECDRRLFNTIKGQRQFLSLIPDDNVRTYDQARNVTSPDALSEAVMPLHQDDRPDWIFCYEERPVLVTELTRHAYTGDNGLQRFARFAAAAEQGVPFIYFGPLKRVRDDELDGDRTASPRSLTSDVFEGMDRLSTVLDVPQIYVRWRTNDSGLPADLPARATAEEIEGLYSELLDVISTVLFTAPLCTRGRPLDDVCLQKWQARTHELAAETNTRFSDVKFPLKPERVVQLLRSPKYTLDLLGADYFSKGKPDKVLAQYALSVSEITAVQLPNGDVRTVTTRELDQLIRSIMAARKFRKPAMIYYTGYKWRSDPHCGVLVNIDYRLCREPGERSAAQRSTGLVVIYPRVSLNSEGAVWNALRRISADDPGAIEGLFRERYRGEAEAKLACLDSAHLYSLWNNTAKQARLFRRYADVVILNDGLVLGEGLAPVISGFASHP